MAIMTAAQRCLQDEIKGVRLIYGDEDWKLVEESPNRAGGVPKSDMTADDGMRVPCFSEPQV
jgi:hypothetical protein